MLKTQFVSFLQARLVVAESVCFADMEHGPSSPQFAFVRRRQVH